MDVWCGDVGDAVWVAKAINPCYFETIASGSLLLLGAALAIMQVRLSVVHISAALKPAWFWSSCGHLLLCKALSRHRGQAAQQNMLLLLCGITNGPWTSSATLHPFSCIMQDRSAYTVLN